MWYAGFFCGRKALSSPWNSFQNCRQVALRLVPEWPNFFWKSEKMGAKFVRTTSTIYKRVERKLLQQPFTPCTVDVHAYKNISLPRYRVPRKTVKFVPVVPKAHGRANVCAHRKSIKPCNLKKKLFLGLFIGDDMQLCTHIQIFLYAARWR